MNAQDPLRMKRILLKRGGWKRGGITSDDGAGRHSLLDSVDYLPFDTKVLSDAFDDNLALLQDRIVFRNGQPPQNPLRVRS
jgi:hypothetical protein